MKTIGDLLEVIVLESDLIVVFDGLVVQSLEAVAPLGRALGLRLEGVTLSLKLLDLLFVFSQGHTVADPVILQIVLENVDLLQQRPPHLLFFLGF